jgi:hypothetical protein
MAATIVQLLHISIQIFIRCGITPGKGAAIAGGGNCMVAMHRAH